MLFFSVVSIRYDYQGCYLLGPVDCTNPDINCNLPYVFWVIILKCPSNKAPVGINNIKSRHKQPEIALITLITLLTLIILITLSKTTGFWSACLAKCGDPGVVSQSARNLRLRNTYNNAQHFFISLITLVTSLSKYQKYDVSRNHQKSNPELVQPRLLASSHR